MGVISLEQTDRLYWLGRYTERVYTTIRLFFQEFDQMIDADENYYQEICRKLDIPDIYGSKECFAQKYPYDESDPNSIGANLLRAHDNAIVLREEIGSEALSYIELAMYELRRTSQSDAPLVGLQKVIDYIMAFWGMVDDSIGNEQIRNIIKFGKRIERVDMYARLGVSAKLIQKEIIRLEHRVFTTGMKYDEGNFQALLVEAQASELNYPAIIQYVESIV